MNLLRVVAKAIVMWFTWAGIFAVSFSLAEIITSREERK